MKTLSELVLESLSEVGEDPGAFIDFDGEDDDFEDEEETEEEIASRNDFLAKKSEVDKFYELLLELGESDDLPDGWKLKHYNMGDYSSWGFHFWTGLILKFDGNKLSDLRVDLEVINYSNHKVETLFNDDSIFSMGNNKVSFSNPEFAFKEVFNFMDDISMNNPYVEDPSIAIKRETEIFYNKFKKIEKSVSDHWDGMTTSDYFFFHFKIYRQSLFCIKVDGKINKLAVEIENRGEGLGFDVENDKLSYGNNVLSFDTSDEAFNYIFNFMKDISDKYDSLNPLDDEEADFGSMRKESLNRSYRMKTLSDSVLESLKKINEEVLDKDLHIALLKVKKGCPQCWDFKFITDDEAIFTFNYDFGGRGEEIDGRLEISGSLDRCVLNFHTNHEDSGDDILSFKSIEDCVKGIIGWMEDWTEAIIHPEPRFHEPRY